MQRAKTNAFQATVDSSQRSQHVSQAAVLEARLRILEFALNHSVTDVMQRVLDEAESLTGSCIGFFHFIDPDQASLKLQAWSTRTKQQYCRAQGEGSHYPIAAAGVWVDCLSSRGPIIYNDYESLTNKKGLPEYHATVLRFVQVPIYRGEAAVAIVGVGNKQSDYDEADVEILSSLADLTWDITSKKIAEEAVRRNEAVSMAVLNSMSANIAVLDREGNILAVNKAWLDFASENGGDARCCGNYLLACANASCKDDPSLVSAIEGISSVLDGSRSFFEMEYPCNTVTENHWFRMMAYPLSHEDGGLVISHEDITARHEADANLAVALKRYRSLFELFPAGVTISNKEGKILESNPMARRYLALDDADLANRTIDDPRWYILRPDGSEMPPSEYASVRALTEQRQVSDVEMGVQRPDGDIRWLNVTAAPFPVEDFGVAITYSDITEKKKADAELQSSSNRFSAIFHKNPVSIILTSAKTKEILDVNDAWLALLGFERHEVIGKTPKELGVWDDPSKRCNLVREVRTHGTVSNYEIKARRKTGEIFDVALFAEIIDVNSEPCMLIMGLDISERKQAEAMIEQAQSLLEHKVNERTAELEAAYREQEAFNYSVSHDLRGPLRALDGFSRILLEEHSAKLNAEGSDCLRRICSAAERMGLLVDDLLQLSRINRAELKVQPVNIGSLFRDSVKRLMDLDPKRSVLLEIEDDMVVHGDPVLLGAMADNFASNAWRYTCKKKVAKISFTSKLEAGRRVYRVKDNGAGFDMAYSHKLFEPFQRLHSEAEFPGVGIGLATVHRIVKRHNGEVWAESTVEKGAAFYFTFQPSL